MQLYNWEEDHYNLKNVQSTYKSRRAQKTFCSYLHLVPQQLFQTVPSSPPLAVGQKSYLLYWWFPSRRILLLFQVSLSVPLCEHWNQRRFGNSLLVFWYLDKAFTCTGCIPAPTSTSFCLPLLPFSVFPTPSHCRSLPRPTQNALYPVLRYTVLRRPPPKITD